MELAFITIGGVLLTGFTQNDSFLSVTSNGSFLASTLTLILYKNQLLGHVSVYLEALAMLLMFLDIKYSLKHKNQNQYHKNISNKVYYIFNPIFNYISIHKWVKIVFLGFIIIVAIIFILPALSSQLGNSDSNNVILKLLNEYNIQ